MADRMDAQEALARVLMDKIRNDKYPSRTQMQVLEATLPREMEGEYLAVLLEKVARERRPSITMLRHIQQLVSG
jgi:hypothetical protein